MGAEFVRGPGQHRVPMRGFARDQRLGMAGAIEQQIRAEIFCDILGHGIDAVADLGDAVGKARQRHGQGIDGLALRIPFGGDRFRDGADRRHDMAAGGRADRLAVQRDGKPAIGRGRAGLLVEALALGRARGASHRLLRIERRMSGDFIE